VRSRHAEPLGYGPVGSPAWRAHAASTRISLFTGLVLTQQRAGSAETFCGKLGPRRLRVAVDPGHGCVSGWTASPD